MNLPRREREKGKCENARWTAGRAFPVCFLYSFSQPPNCWPTRSRRYERGLCGGKSENVLPDSSPGLKC